MAIEHDKVKHLQLWSGRIGHAFLALASAICAYGGWVWGDGNIAKSIIFAFFMALTPWAVAYMLPFVSVAKTSGRPLAAGAFGMALLIAGAMEWRAEMMVFAGQRSASTVNATMQQARYEDARNAIGDLERRLKVAQAKLEEQMQHGPSASYDSQIKMADERAELEAQKRGGKGKNYDAAIKLASDLRAKQAIAKDRETNTEPNVKQLAADLEAARKTASETKAGDSMSGAEANLLAAFWTGKLNPGDDARKWTDLWLGAFMALFLLVIPTSLIYASQIDWTEKPAKKRSAFFAKLKAWMHGEKAAEQPIETNTFAQPRGPLEVNKTTVAQLRTQLRQISAA